MVDVWENTKRFWGIVENHKWSFFLLLFFSLLVEISYLLGKFLFKMIIDGGADYTSGILPRSAFINILILVVVVYGVLIVVRSAGRWLFQEMLIRVDVNIMMDLKRKFFNHIVHLDYNFHTTHKTGQLISRMTRGGRSIENMMDSIAFNFASMLFQFVMSVIALAAIGWETAVMLVIFIVTFLGFSLYYFIIQLNPMKTANDVEDKEKGDMSDIFANIESIKYYGKEKQIRKRYEELTHNTKNAFIVAWEYYRTASAGQEIIFSVSAICVMLFPVLQLLNGTATPGDVAFAYAVFVSLIGNVFGFMHGVRTYYRGMVDFESLYEYDAFTSTVRDESTEEMRVTKGKIEFKDISFGYQNAQLFKAFNLTIEPNTKVALVGRSGAGKSTLVKLLYRFYDSDMGSIEIDGVDIKDVEQESLRAELSIVPQEGVLFDDTIFNNIAFSNPTASKEEVWKAIRFAQLDKLISTMPKKEKTIVGERGVRLSGGERQRVSIARALLANKKVLVLDEATSALDSETEHDIQKDLQELMKNRTSIIIAHRLSTIMSADKIIVLENGEIVQQGTHEQLVKKEGTYKKLWSMQRGGYIE